MIAMEDAKRQLRGGTRKGNPSSCRRRVARMVILLSGCLVLAVGTLAPMARGAQAPSPGTAGVTPPPPPAGYTRTGADTCLLCHNTPKVKAIFSTKHAVMADSRTPFAGNQCEACHGPGAQHVQPPAKGKKRTPVPFFAPNSPASVAQENAVCLTCHKDAPRMAWHGSIHQREGLACVSCHTIHARHNPALEAATQAQVCYRCHKGIRADFEKFSHHPVATAQLTCGSCHNPHGSFGPMLLNQDTVNQTCYQCHAAKRGPFLWEHPPVQEDCLNCHVPHGSVNPHLLVSRPPLLCQQCHAPSGHPSIAFGPGGLPSGKPNGFLLARSCMNCHSRIHGSNDPSGAPLSR
jgi:DmsE family decaheme c-type cytochrome